MGRAWALRGLRKPPAGGAFPASVPSAWAAGRRLTALHAHGRGSARPSREFAREGTPTRSAAVVGWPEVVMSAQVSLSSGAFQ